MTDAVAVRESIALQRPYRDPEEIIAQGKRWADGLMRVVRETKISKKIGNREHLQLEAWQTIATFDRKSFTIEWTKPIERSGEFIGFEARAGLVDLDTGLITVHAEASCLYEEDNWSERDEYAVKSMAQTRACGKVGRMAYAWVAVLAGYSGTPAEEMTEPNEEGPRVPFGRDKGKLVSELTVAKDISWLADAVAKSISDPAKARYKPQNERLYTALTARLADLNAPVAAPPRDKEVPQPSDDSHGADATVQPAAAEADPSKLEPPTVGVRDPRTSAGAVPSWREQFLVNIIGLRDDRDPKGLVLKGTLSALGYAKLEAIPTQEKAEAFQREYLARTGKPRQEAMPV